MFIYVIARKRSLEILYIFRKNYIFDLNKIIQFSSIIYYFLNKSIRNLY